MDKNDIRRARLRQVIDERFDGKVARLAAFLEMKPPQLHRWLSGKQGIHEDSAASMCEKIGLPAGWFDLPPDSSLPLPASKVGMGDNVPPEAATELWRSYQRADTEAQRVVDIVLDRERGEVGATLKSAITTALLAAKREPAAGKKTA